MGSDPRERFAELIREPDERIDIAEAALLVAAEEFPGLSVDEYLERLDALASSASPRLCGAGTDAERVARLNHFLFEEEGFSGDREHYDDPRNSYLNQVLDRREGLPITLSMVYMEVGRRVGFDVRGIGFPGHFLSKYVGDEEIIVDAFFGVTLSRQDCADRLRTVIGEDAVLDPEVHLRAARPCEILVRLLTNLKYLYIRSADWPRALACCDRILLFDSDQAVELRDRGVVYEQLECFASALEDLERFVELAPDDDSAGVVRERIESLTERVRRLH